VEVAEENEPPLPDAVHVTVLPAVATSLPLASWSWAVTVTVPPTVGVAVDSVTAYRVAVPEVTAKAADVPDFPLTRLDAPVPVAVRVTPDSALEYVTPEMVTADAPTAIVPDVVPPTVPVPAPRVRVTVPVAPVLFTALPNVSVSVTVTGNPTPAVCDPIDDTTNLEAIPGLTTTDAVLVSAEAPDPVFSVPEIVAVPASVPEVNVAVYVPLPTFVTEPTEPRLVDSATVPPEEVRLLPKASFSCTVITEVPPLIASGDVAAEMVDWLRLTGPGLVANVPDAEDVVTVDELTVPDALMTCPEPVTVGVIATASTKPPLAIVPVTEPLNAPDVRVTVPVYAVLSRPPESRARIRTLNAVPAVCGDATAVVPPDWVTMNCVTAPKGVTDDADVVALLVPFAFVAVTVNVYAVPAVSPVTVHEVEVAGLGVQVRPPGDDVTV